MAAREAGVSPMRLIPPHRHDRGNIAETLSPASRVENQLLRFTWGLLAKPRGTPGFMLPPASRVENFCSC
jgi:hypothetical protein